MKTFVYDTIKNRNLLNKPIVFKIIEEYKLICVYDNILFYDVMVTFLNRYLANVTNLNLGT